MLRIVRRQALQNVRFNSTSATAKAQATAAKAQATAAKAQGTAASLLAKGTAVLNQALYWSKVGLELGKYVWTKESLSPPSGQQFQKVFTQDLPKFLQTAKSSFSAPQALLDRFAAINKDQVIKGGAVAVQLLGLFSLGEIIGRRHIYGYKNYEH